MSVRPHENFYMYNLTKRPARDLGYDLNDPDPDRNYSDQIGIIPITIGIIPIVIGIIPNFFFESFPIFLGWEFGMRNWVRILDKKLGWEFWMRNWDENFGWKTGMRNFGWETGMRNWNENFGWETVVRILDEKLGWEIGMKILDEKLGWDLGEKCANLRAFGADFVTGLNIVQ